MTIARKCPFCHGVTYGSDYTSVERWGSEQIAHEMTKAVARLTARCARLEGALLEIAKLAEDAKEATTGGLRTHYALSQIRDRARGAAGEG